MKSIVVFNQKGGVGKTSTVANLMAEYTACGKKVVAFDLDAQGNLTRFLQVRTQNENTVRELLLGEATFEETVRHTMYGDVVPADDTLQGELLRFASMPTFILRLQKLVGAIKGYDILLMDCPPSANQVTAAALVAGDYALIPTEAEYFSATGVEKLSDTIDQLREINDKLRVLGILLVKYNPRRSLTQSIEDAIVGAASSAFGSRVFDTKIPFTTDVPSSQAMRQSVRDYKKSSRAAQCYAALAQEILKEL